MKIHKSVHMNFLIYSPLFMIGAWIIYSSLISDFNRYWFVGGVLLILLFHFCRHQYNLYQHTISIEGTKLHIISNNHQVQFNLEDIKHVNFTNNILSLTSARVTYKFNLAMFNVRKVDDFIKQLKALTS